MDAFWQDIRYALRMLARNPGFALVIVLTLALGVGVNTAVFSVGNFVILRPMPVKNPEQLVVLATREKGSSEVRDVSYPDFLDYRRQAAAFSDMLAYRLGFDTLAADNRAEQLITNYVTGNFFSTLGIRPAIGRPIDPNEGWTPGADPVVVLGYSYWQRRFGGDPNVVGKSALLNARPVTIVGVAQKQFPGPYYFLETDIYVPLGQSAPAADSFWTARGERGEASLFALARLKPGVSLAQGRTSLQTVAARLAQQYPEAEKNIGIELYPERLARPQASAANDLPVLVPLFLLLAFTVLLVACINVANLVLARANERAGEMAVRSALGAGRIRLVRQLLTEDLILAAFGGLAAVFVGKWIAGMLEKICTPIDLPIFRIHLVFDWRVFAYTLGITMLAGIIVGLIPARKLWRADLNPVLHEGSRTLSAGRGRHRQRDALVVVQVAGSTILLIMAGLFVRMLTHAQRMDLGFDPHHVMNFLIDVKQLGYDEVRGKKLYSSLMERVGALPGIESASYAFSVPFSTSGTLSTPVYVEHQILQPGQSPPAIYYNIVTPTYFKTLGVTLLGGRAFTETDHETAPAVAIISQYMAEHLWPGQDPIGKHFRMAKDGDKFLEVIGIARDAKYVNPVPWTVPYFYIPLAQHYTARVALQVRSPVPPETLVPQIEREVHRLEPALALTDVMTMDQQTRGANGFFLLNLGADAASGLGILALLLAIIGIYGVVSHAASQRAHEIGIRLALGAQRADILKMILREGLLLVAMGASAGIVAALAVAHAVSHFLLGVGASDPLTYGSVAFLLAAAATIASYLPARRAMHVDPIVALRHE